MATTDRDFDDERILAELNKLTGFSIGKDAELRDLTFDYPAPYSNGVAPVEIRVELVIRLDAETADSILFNAK
jgi:hypothetical protein